MTGDSVMLKDTAHLERDLECLATIFDSEHLCTCVDSLCPQYEATQHHLMISWATPLLKLGA